jgi:cytochrome c
MNIFKTAAVGFALMASPAFADGHATGDAGAGEDVFKKCKACHSVIDAAGEVVVKGGRNGPNLYGIYGRVAGSEEDWGKKFGDSIVAVGEAGLVWDETNFIAYVADPRDFLRTTLDDKKARSKMSFKLKDDQDKLDVWAYLVSVGPEVVPATE